MQTTADGSVYALGLSGEAIWRIDAATATATVAATPDVGKHFQAFLATNGGNLFHTQTDFTAYATTWLHADATVTDLGYPNNVINAPKAYGASGMTFLTNGIAGAELLTPSGTTVLRQFIEPLLYPRRHLLDGANQRQSRRLGCLAPARPPADCR